MRDRLLTGEPTVASALLFDLYGTLADTRTMVDAVAPLTGDAEQLARSWRVHQLQISWLLTLQGSYEDFDTVTAYALEVALAEAGLRTSDLQRRHMLERLDQMVVFDDVVPALDSLAAAGHVLGVLSNGSPRSLESLLSAAGIRDCFQHLISADEVRAFKPAPSVYRLAGIRVGVPVGELLLVSANPFDAAGAKAAGMRVAQLERGPSFTYAFASAPDLTIQTLLDLPGAVRPVLTTEVMR
jgi:2-haloacid dehalogenase